MSLRPAKNPASDDADLEIEIAAADAGLESREEDPAQREELALLPLGKPTHDPRWLVAFACLKQILAHGQRFNDTEIGGVLLGRIWRSPRGRVTEVAESLPAVKTEAGLGHVTFSHETWQEIYNEMERRPPELRIVGWYHSHPGFGVFYSEHDRFIQRHFFSGEGQLGIVVDPQRSALAAFECREGEVEELPGLLLTADRATSGAAHNLLKTMNYD
jgi:proteasome lid subunit RPN8/RPN11